VLAVVIHAFKYPLFPGPGGTRYIFGHVVGSLREAVVSRWLSEINLESVPFSAVTLISLTSVALGSLYKIRRSLLAVRSWPTAGRTMRRNNTADPDDKGLRHVVEEMAIASGMSVPESTCSTMSAASMLFRRSHPRRRGHWRHARLPETVDP